MDSSEIKLRERKIKSLEFVPLIGMEELVVRRQQQQQQL
jgi:hypothetical protein